MKAFPPDTTDKSSQTGSPDAVEELLACLAPGVVVRAVEHYVADLIQEIGLADFVEKCFPAFNRAVGDAWAAGHLEPHAEYRYTSAVQAVVQSHLAGCQPAQLKLRILLTTPPGERHGLGLLAVPTLHTPTSWNCVTPCPNAAESGLAERAFHGWMPHLLLASDYFRVLLRRSRFGRR